MIRLLVADDDPIVRAGLTRLLESCEDVDALGCGYLMKDAEPEELVRGIRAVASGESLAVGTVGA